MFNKRIKELESKVDQIKKDNEKREEDTYKYILEREVERINKQLNNKLEIHIRTEQEQYGLCQTYEYKIIEIKINNITMLETPTQFKYSLFGFLYERDNTKAYKQAIEKLDKLNVEKLKEVDSLIVAKEKRNKNIDKQVGDIIKKIM